VAQNKKRASVEAAHTKSNGKFVYYTVKKGDNLWDISQKFSGVDVSQLKRLNKNVNTNNLKLGSVLKIKPIG